MSRSELERLARIRIQITGETLERAMAVLGGELTPLGGELTPPEPANELSPASGHDTEPDDSDAETDDDAAAPGSRQKPQRRNHLRGL
ncbi:hypothetical protein ACGFOU_32210 [Streptomyces sp. NPDC048595]|uniref:hypothetical protein n=1 Tax=Streptomyces sp. NPDC048595 TaxID=3365576 RepID=UPI00372322D3